MDEDGATLISLGLIWFAGLAFFLTEMLMEPSRQGGFRLAFVGRLFWPAMLLVLAIYLVWQQKNAKSRLRSSSANVPLPATPSHDGERSQSPIVIRRNGDVISTR